jgi:hypothetical protein
MKTRAFEIDWDSYESVKAVFQKCKTRMLQLDTTRVTKKEKNRDIFEAALEICDTDIDHLYNDDSDGEKHFYVYAHCDPTRKLNVSRGLGAFAASYGMFFEPFYIGMGHGRRAYDTKRNETHRKCCEKIAMAKLSPEIKVLKSDLTMNQALAFESKLIDIFGLLGRGGCLTNLDEGASSRDRFRCYGGALRRIRKYNDQFLALHQSLD